MEGTGRTNRIYCIDRLEEYSPNISTLVSMMKLTRTITLHAARGLSVEQLDYLHDKESNSIGMLLFHIATTEKWYQIETFEGRVEFTEEEKKFWDKGTLENRQEALKIRGNNLDYYRDLLSEVKNVTYERLKAKDDNWLKEESFIWGEEYPLNNWFKWFHVFEDEINHRGQINWLRKRLRE
jgi:uncharacterized damage-inducible protein DinB